MIIHRSIVWSKIVDWTTQESDVVSGYFDNFECGESLLHDNSFYSGLVPWLKKHGVSVDIESDSIQNVIPIQDVDVCYDILDGLKLRDYQIAATRKAVHFGRGIIQAPTGSGKTQIAASVYAHLNLYGLVTTMVYLTPTVFLMEQTADKLREFGFGSVCKVGGGHKFKFGYDVYVFVIDSAYRGLAKPEISECIRNSDMLVLDEAHHASSKSWTKVCEHCQAPYRFAYTATVHDDPVKYSYIDLVLIGLVGPIIFEVRSKELRDRGYLADPLVTIVKTDSPKVRVYDWSRVYLLGIVENKKRNTMIMSVASSCFESGNKIMVFISRKKHGHRLSQGICDQVGSEVCFVHGNNTVYVYRPSGVVNRHRWSVDKIASYVNDKDRAVLVTTTVLDEGFDVPVINVLIMGTAMKKYRRTVQRCGRGMRPKEGQNRVFIFDFYDNNHPYLEKHSKYRLWTYKTEVFEVSESLQRTSEILGNAIVLERKAM